MSKQEKKIAGIVTEYNPFHNGHSWLNSAVRAHGATHIVTIMSGNFIQRGGPALFPKQTRAQAAIAGGSDLVLELPLPYAMATAQKFADGAVSLLAALGCVNTLAFGSECGDCSKLWQATKLLSQPTLITILKEHLAKGVTFAKARQSALEIVADSEIAQLFSTPNNTLAIEYLSAIERHNFSMDSLTFPRQGIAHDSTIPSPPFASATYLREQVQRYGLSALKAFVPNDVLNLYQCANQKGLLPCREETFYPMLLSSLRQLKRNTYKNLPDIAEGLEERLYHSVRQAVSYPQLLELVKTKRYPLARIRRLIWSAFLGITCEDTQTTPPYLRILAMNARGREILSMASPKLPLSASLRNLERNGGHCARIAQLEAQATDLYALAMPSVQPCGIDYTYRLQVNP